MATRIFFIAIALGLIIAAIWAYEHDQRLTKNLSQVTIGDPNEVVRELLGDPTSEGECGEMTLAPKECVNEYVYRYWYSIFQPQYLVVWFDHDGKVIGEQQIRSHF